MSDKTLYTDDLDRFYAKNRIWQGIPGIERTDKGRLFATFYSGGHTEMLGNFCPLLISDDGGQSWSEPIAVAYYGEDYRCYDPCLWIDPQNRLWFCWGVMPEHMVWAAICENPDAQKLEWYEPFPIAGDVMMNKPTVLSDGRWLFPIAKWSESNYVLADKKSQGGDRLAFAYETCDGGKSFTRLGGADVKGRAFDEHMIVEYKDGSLGMYVRTNYGIGLAVSIDSGKSWSEGTDSGLGGPNSRFHIRRLESGRLLLINHWKYTGRSNLTAMLSDDDGKSWYGYLTLDERNNISYPDCKESGGALWITYDRERGAMYTPQTKPENCAREILLARVTEKDIAAGKLIDGESFVKRIITKL